MASFIIVYLNIHNNKITITATVNPKNITKLGSTIAPKIFNDKYKIEKISYWIR